MAFLIDGEDKLNEGILDSLRNLGKNTLGKIKDKIADVLSDKIKHYTKTSFKKVISDELDDEVQEQFEDDITDICTSALDNVFNLGESEDEFDAEGDRYEELKNKLLGGQTMKYEEMEELLAAAKSRNDQRVVGILKNVVDDPPTDAVTESEKEPTKAELLDKLIKMCKSDSGLRTALEEIKDKFALDESTSPLGVIVGNIRHSLFERNAAEIARAFSLRDILYAFMCLVEPGSELFRRAEAIKNLMSPAKALTRSGLVDRPGDIFARYGQPRYSENWHSGGYYKQKVILTAFAEKADGEAKKLAQDMLNEFFDKGNNLVNVVKPVLMEAGFDVFDRPGVTPDGIDFKTPADADEVNAALDKLGIIAEPCGGQCGNRRFKLDIKAAKAGAVSEDNDIEEKEELLPDCVVNEALETLRRMY